MPETAKSWNALLRRPFPCEHLIQFYSDEDVLIRALAHFVGSGLEQGEAAVVVATSEHIAALKKRLASTGITVTNTARQGALVAVDAKRCLAKFMIDGTPDRAAFRSTISPLLDRIRHAGYGKIRLFGEMVNLLWRQDHEATIRLEELWNEVLAEYEVCLLCAYRIDPIDAQVKRGLLHQITRCHSHSFSEDDELLAHAVDGDGSATRPPFSVVGSRRA